MTNEIGYLIQANDEAEQAYQYPVSQDYLIGSSVECNLKITAEDVSDLHCRIRFTNNEVCIFSLSTQNPVYVNEQPVSEEGIALNDTDVIRINDDHQFKWKTTTDRRIFSRSLPLDNAPESAVEVNARYSDSALITWKNVDCVPEESTDVTLRNAPIQQDEDNQVREEEKLSETDSVEKSNVSIPYEINRSTVECGNKSKSFVSTPVKSHESVNPVSPFAASNASVSNSKNNTSKISHIPDECTTDVTLRNESLQQDDESIDEEKILSKNDGVEKSNVSIPYEMDRSSVKCGNKSKSFVRTPIKSQKAISPVSPFTASNASVSNSKHSTSRISHQNDDTEAELDCSARNIPEDMLEDLMSQPGSQKAFHSTPKAPVESKNRKIARSSSSVLEDANFEKDNEIDTSDLMMHYDVAEKTAPTSEKSLCNESKRLNSASKKSAITPTKRASEQITESRRNTRGRTSLLRKTFEENSCDNEAKSLTTPEKLAEASNITQTSFLVDSEMEHVTDTNLEYKSLNESSKAALVSVSDENDTCEASFIDKYKMCNVVKNTSASKADLVAKCARNLSYISPPENNRSQEYMDSMVTTPQKHSTSVHDNVTENCSIMTPSFLSNTKDSSYDESINTSLSSARKRRSTGFTPFVGTPSNEYRVTRKMSTPFSRSVLSRTSVDFEATSRDSKQSFERRSTPYKVPAGKSSMRDSISCQPTIQENASFEELEAANHEYDSINDPKFRFITKRRKQRYGENTFAEEDRILEESELKSDCTEVDNDCSLEEENTIASVTNASIISDDCDELSNEDGTETETAKNALELKSILTPLPKSLALKEKSAKRVTFVLPSSPECTINKEDTTLSVEESFAMISSSKPATDERSLAYDSITSDEELHASDRQETDLSYNTASEPEASSIAEKCDESSMNISSSQSQTKIQSNLNDLSGVEQIQSPEPSPTIRDVSAIEDDDVLEADSEANTPPEASKHSSANITDVESSLVSSEPSNRSNLGDQERTRTFIETESAEEIQNTTANHDLNDRNSTKISSTPGILLSGIKTLFKTPENPRKSTASTGGKLRCILNFTPSSGSKTNTGKSASARKSVDVTRKTASVTSSRMCKSLTMNEISKSKSLSVEEIQIDQSKETIEATEKEIAVENVSNEDSASVELVADSTNETSTADIVIPEIVVTEATFVDQNQNNQTLELTNETPEEPMVEDSNVESSNETQIRDESKLETSDREEETNSHNDETVSFEERLTDDAESKFETSDHEEETNPQDDDTVSFEGSLTDDAESPVITQKRPSSVCNIELDSKSSPESETRPEENKSLTMVSFKENEPEKAADSDTSGDTSSIDVPSDASTLPMFECAAEPVNESASSLEVMVSDRDNSRLCDPLSPENINDANSSKTSITESSCNNSQSYDSPSKHTSDLDASKISVIDDSLDNSQISDTFSTDCNDFDTLKKDDVATNLDNSVTGALLFKETDRIDVSQHNASRKNNIVECLSAETVMAINVTQKLDEIEDKLDTNSVNVSRSTASSQEEGIKINASSGLINDLEKELESTPDPSDPSSGEATPSQFFKPVSFPESSNTSRIDSAVSTLPEDFTKPDLPSEIDPNAGIFTPIRNAFRESSTPRSSVIRCRKSLRIHKCNPDNTANKSCISLHDCSIISDESQTQADVENIQSTGEIHEKHVDESQTQHDAGNDKEHVVDELNIELATVNEKCDVIQELSTTEENTPEEQSEPVLCPESTQLSYSVLSPSHSATSPTQEITISTNQADLSTTDDEQLENPSNEIVENASTDPIESSDVHQVTADVSKAPTVDENISQQSVDTVIDKRRSLRIRKDHQEVVTRTRQRGPQSLKTKMMQLKEDLEKEHDDKENVCSLLKVIDKPNDKTKKTELSTDQITAEEPSVTEKKPRNQRRLKNVENIAGTEAESQQSVEEAAGGKRSCSIVLTPLDPEIIKSPVKIDESDNISPINEPAASSKRKRTTKAATKTEQKPAPSTFRTRQKTVKAVTFDIAERKSEEVAQQTAENDAQSETTSKKRNLRSKPSIVKPAAASKSKKINEPEKNYEVNKTIKIQLEPVDESFTSPIQPVDKRTRSKRVVATTTTTTKAQKPEKETKETKTKTPRATKRAPENVEEENAPELPKRRRIRAELDDESSSKKSKRGAENVEENTAELPKRTRVRAKLDDESSSKENAKSNNNNEIVKELPKKTRARAKTNVQVEPETTANNLIGKPTRATRNKPENVTSDSSTSAKKRVIESSTQINSEKSNKKTKMVKGVELDDSFKTAAVKKATKKPTRNITIEEPVASTSKKILTPRVTRSRKTEIVKSKTPPPKITAKGTRVAKKKPIVVDDEDTPVTSKRTVNVKKSPTPVTSKRAVVTRAKKISVQKGRISSTLKTTSRGSLVVRKSARTASEEKTTSNTRSTRRRAN
ncbi:titin-like isoform X2 [Planococcus citri]|uniref:titin-like isoform X2 n=1 Tax=Planococcus citri TaxID=170843 RepID=UPI0031F8EBD6